MLPDPYRFTVGEYEYVSLRFPAFEALDIQAELEDAVIPFLTSVVGTVVSLESIQNLDLSKLNWEDIRKSAEGLFLKIPGKRRVALIKRLLGNTKLVVNEGTKSLSNETVVNAHFKGALDDLYLVSWEVFRHNFFGSRVSGLLEKLQAGIKGMLKSPAPSPIASNDASDS